MNNLFGYLYVVDSIKCWSRWSLAQLTDDDCVFDEVGTSSCLMALCFGFILKNVSVVTSGAFTCCFSF